MVIGCSSAEVGVIKVDVLEELVVWDAADGEVSALQDTQDSD